MDPKAEINEALYQLELLHSLTEMNDKVDFAHKELEKTAPEHYLKNIKNQIIEFSKIKFNETTNNRNKMEFREDLSYLKNIKHEYIDEIKQINKIPMVNVNAVKVMQEK